VAYGPDARQAAVEAALASVSALAA
jgi:hypothetical protein